MLEFDKIRSLVAGYCNGSMAREQAERLQFFDDYDTIARELERVAEFVTLFRSADMLPASLGQVVRGELNMLRIQGSMLSEVQVWALHELAVSVDAVKRFFKSKPAVYPVLEAMAQPVVYDKNIVLLIEKVIDTDKQVKSSASEELGRIRDSLQRSRNELNRAFARALNKLQKDDMLADIDQSIRNGRRVVAVFAEHKRQVRGMVHGYSDTGKTTFIEPEETIELNNLVVDLEQQERVEVLRILKELTAKLHPFYDTLMDYQRLIAAFDLLYAKCKLAIDLDASKPKLNKQAGFKLIKAYHPLLLLHHRKQKKDVVPLDLELNHKNRILIISGPNAGGKTVTLKLAGLLQLMVQAGLLVPASPESEFGIFSQLMVSIGDTQSIEYELSTYSAHLSMMKHFTLHADKRTLFLIDEFGTGSDPLMGGAFAEAILERLAENGAIGVVTTHYLNLKTMAERVGGLVNGAMEFDETNLMPLYKLQIGKPGSSYTFAIAERIGIPKAIVQRARELTPKQQYQLENTLRQLQGQQQDIQRRLKELSANEQTVAESKAKLEQLNAQKEELIEKEVNRKTREQLNKVKETEQRLRQLIGEWNRADDKSKVSHRINEITMKNTTQRKKTIKAKEGEVLVEDISGLVVGDTVKIKHLNRYGTVTEISKKQIKALVNGLPMMFEPTQVVKVISKAGNEL